MSASKKSIYVVFVLIDKEVPVPYTDMMYNKQVAIKVRNQQRKLHPTRVFEVYKIEKV